MIASEISLLMKAYGYIVYIAFLGARLLKISAQIAENASTRNYTLS